MKKGLLALAALTGTALSANAALLKISDQTFANFGLKLQVYGQSLEDAANNGQDNAIDFTIQNARVYFSGQLNPIVQFGANLDFTVTGANTSHEGTSTTKVRDAFINFHLMPQVNVMAGYYRVPFSRETLTDRYDRIFMPQDGWVNNAYKDQILPTLYIANTAAQVRITASNVLGGPSLGNAVATTGITDESDFARDAGVTVWGNVDVPQAVAIKYYVGIYDGFGDHNAAEAASSSGKDNLGYAFRIQITPTAWGFQPERGYLVRETYLGNKNAFSIGLGYAASKLDLGTSSYSLKAWTFDVNWEQKLVFNNIALVPKVEAGYVHKNCDSIPFATTANAAAAATLDKIKTSYITLGALYDEVVGLGKVGFYLKYEKSKIDTTGLGSIKPSVWTIAVPYYLAGQNAKVVLQWNHYDYDKAKEVRGANDNNKNSDWTLAFQVEF